MAAQFVWDMTVPNGLADWVWYFIPVYLSIFVGGRLFSYLVASLISFLIVIGFYCSPQGIDPEIALVGRLMGIAVIWLMCVIIAHYKEVEKERQRIQRALKTISACNSVLVRATGEPELLHEICRIAVEQGDYRMAWVGFAKNDVKKTVQVAARAGRENDYLEKAQITWSDEEEHGRGPTGMAIRSGETVVCNDFQNDERTAPWWAEGRKHGYFSSITIPIVSGKQNFGVFVLYAGQRNAFSPHEVRLLTQLAEELAFGIHALRTRTERQAAELAIDENRSRLALSAEATGLGIWEWNVLTNKIRWDAQMFRLYGVAPTPDMFVDYSVWRNAVLPEELAQQEAMLQANARSGGPGQRTFHIRRANDGACRRLEAVETARKNAGGELEWVFGTNLDITERAQAAEALQATQARLQFLLANTPAVIYSLRVAPELKITFISPNAMEILGHAPEKFTEDAGFWFRHLHPEDAAALAKGFFNEAAAKAGVASREYRFRHADGSYRWMRDEMRAIPNGQEPPIEYVGHWYDISEQRRADDLRRKSEAQFEALFARHQACKLVIDPATGGIRNANDAALKFYGWPLEKIRQMRIHDLSTQAAGDVDHRLAEIVKQGGAQFESRHRRADGTVCDVEVFITPIETDGKILLYSINLDITARKRAEVTLQSEQASLKGLLNATTEIVWLFSPDCRILVANKIAARSLGKPVEEVIGCPYAEVVPPELAKTRLVRVREVLRTNAPLEFEDVWCGMSFQNSLYPVGDADGKVTGVVCYSRDITERRKVEAAVREQAGLIKSLLDSVPDLIFFKGIDGVYLGANPAFAGFVGCPVEQIIGRTDYDLFARELADSFRKYDRIMLDTLQSQRNEEWVDYPDGRRVLLDTLKTPYCGPDGKLLGVLGVSRDITDRKQAEEALRKSELRFRTLVETAPEAIFIRAGNEFVYLNTAALRLFGADSPAELLGHPVLDRFAPDCREAAGERMRRLDEAGEYTHMVDREFIRLDGASVQVIVSAMPFKFEKRDAALVFAQDITERKQAEAALRESEQRMRDIVFTMADWVWETDENGRYTYSSQKGNDWFGGILGKTPFDLMPPEEARRITPIFTDVAGRKAPIRDLENWTIRKDGTLACLLTNGVPILDQAGNLRGYRGVDKDITERKRSEEKLIRSERLLRDTQEMAKTGFYINNLSTGLWESSPSLDKLFGIGPDFKRDTEGWGSLMHPDDRERTVTYFLKVLAEKKPFRMDYRIRRPSDGELRWMAGYGDFENDENGNPVRLVGCIQDITDRKQSEEEQSRLATALEQSGEAIVITDTEGKILYINPAFEKTSGYTRAEALGKTPRLLKSGKQEPSFYRQLWETLGRGATWEGHFINQRKDGTLYEEDAAISPIRDAAGKIVNYVAVKHDVTHEVELEGQLRQSQKMEAMGTLAGGIAHDFNNILNVIFGYCNLLRLDFAGKPDKLEKLGEILKAGERAKGLVQQILTFSRRQEQERLVIHLNTVVKESIKLMRASLPANLQIDSELAADAPLVLADATQIYQVVMNLGTNALHAMEKQASGRLKIDLDAFQPDAKLLQAHPELRAIKYARLTISDTGCGMDARTLARIYDPFFTTKPVGKGTGLGLAVVHGIVESHDGVITVESHPGQGTTFRIYLPEQIQDLFQDGIPEDLIPCGQGQRILMVDDETALVGMYQKLLKALKYDGTIVIDPEEAVGLVRKNPGQYDLVITDLTMPKLSGLEVARQIREIRADMPVILATGFQGTVSDRQLTDAGVCEVLEKPISMAKLAMALRGILGKKPGTGLNNKDAKALIETRGRPLA